jgi:hypothetical protein
MNMCRAWGAMAKRDSWHGKSGFKRRGALRCHGSNRVKREKNRMTQWCCTGIRGVTVSSWLYICVHKEFLELRGPGHVNTTKAMNNFHAHILASNSALKRIWASSKLTRERNFLNLREKFTKTTNSIFLMEMEYFAHKIRYKARRCSLTTSNRHCIRGSSQYHRQEKELNSN